MKTYNLQSEQAGSNALLVLGFLGCEEVRFNRKLLYDKQKSMYKIAKDVDTIHSITFEFPVKDFRILLDDEVVFKCSSLVAKVIFDPSLNTFMYKTLWIDFKHHEQNFDPIGIDIAGGLPIELKPDPILNCSVFKERTLNMFEQPDNIEIKVYQMAFIRDMPSVSIHKIKLK